ncbi:patatin-like phospholipase family protein [Rhodoferax saidenbachensis]|uniref:Acylesterase/phospholipase RssA n=1 Tax=Rhodoferax saidenbachensis TaxID=1484693 RepID=A0ABU1ZPG6_9BURK|nr:patatin-like phospholipase family protein [Rhodoferax saidenbachensis]MDR7307459.1 putative acylesterase/phospholipase RssA [Rhodoferax saidenbachensis]
MTQAQKYQRCMVMAGGGFRYGIYLGMYAAACEVGQQPDVVLASCGASIAAALIHSVPDDVERRAWLASPEMYQFWCSFRPAARATLPRTLGGVTRRALRRAAAPTVPDLFGDYLFVPPAELPTFPVPSRHGGTDIAIVGSRLLFTEEEVGQRRGSRKLLEETVFCAPRTAELLQGASSPFASLQWGNTVVAPTVVADIGMPLNEAVRISVSDMFYFPAHRHGAAYYTGGVVDLFPIELAHCLAHEVVMEFKSEFEQVTSVPAWRAVLGIDANQRLRHVHAQQASVWIDASDISQALARQTLQKKIVWRKNRIDLLSPVSHAVFAQHMQDQWDYGYQRGLEAFARVPRGTQTGMRNVNRYNRGRV